MDEKRDFNAQASSWDDNPVRVKLAQDVADAIISSVKITPDTDVLDFGCGTGLVTLALSRHAGSITGADSSRGMLEALDRKISLAGISNVKTLYYDADDNAPIPGSYGVIVSSMAFHHVRDVAALIRRLHEALVPGGKLCVADLDPDEGLFHSDNTGVFHFGFEREDLRRVFTTAGFLEVRDITATEVIRPVSGGSRSFSVFLLTGIKPL